MEHVYRRLNALPQRVTLDANVLLNAAFVRQCTADLAIRLLSARRYSLLVDVATLNECRSVLAKKSVRLGLDHYPIDWLESYLLQLGVLIVPEAAICEFKAVNRRDLAVASAAQHNDSFLLTGDLKLLAECETDAIAARSPADVLLTGGLEWGTNDPMAGMFQATPMRRDRGAFFARVFTGEWAGAVNTGSFTVLHVQNVGRLLFDAGRSAWVFANAVGEDVVVPAAPSRQQPWIVLASFDCGKGTIRLRAGVASSPDYEERETAAKQEIGADGTGQIAFGRTATGTDSWNGHLGRVVVSESIPSSETWRSVMQVPGLAPDPASGDILDAALRRVTAVAGTVRLPTARELAHKWL
jgi:hypothetical protein